MPRTGTARSQSPHASVAVAILILTLFLQDRSTRACCTDKCGPSLALGRGRGDTGPASDQTELNWDRLWLGRDFLWDNPACNVTSPKTAGCLATLSLPGSHGPRL